jgi:uncharacterized protein YndB with AHSA1/START domain
MTTDKARKRAIRSRMTKTGERYAAARRHVVPVTTPQPTLPPRVAEPTMSEASIRKGTGRGWDDWFRLLDAWDATTHTHTEIARYVRDEFGVDGWWAQSVTVGYEWARGLRRRHEVPGGFQVSVTKTIDASAADVWRDFVEPRRRERWLEPGALRVRSGTGTLGKSARFDAPDGRLVHIWLDDKGDRCSVAVTCEKLDGPEEVAAMRAIWRERLAALAERWRTAAVAPGVRRAS